MSQAGHEGQTAPGRAPRSWRRRLVRLCLVVLLLPPLLLAGLGLGLWGGLRTEWGRDLLRRGVVAWTAEPNGAGFDLAAIEGELPGRLVLRDLAVRDAAGPWLEIARLELVWRPWRLLSRQVEIESLAADEVRLQRLPEAAEPQTADDGAFELPRLPVGVALNSLSIPSFTLGAPVLGVPATLAIAGRLGLAESGVAKARLAVTRTDGLPGRIEATATYARDGGVLKVDLAAEEPSGGLVARLFDLPGQPPLQAKLAGEGPLDAWCGQLSGEATGLAKVSAELTASAVEPMALTAEGEAELAELVPSAARAFVSPRLSFALDVGLREGGDILDVRKAAFRSQAAALSGTGSLDLTAASLKLTGELDLKDPASLTALFDEPTVAGLRAEFTAEGPLSHPAVELSAEVRQAAFADFALDSLRLTASLHPDGPLDRAAASLAIEARASGEGLATGNADLAGLLAPSLTLDFAGSYALDSAHLELARANLANGDLRVKAAGTYALDSGAADFNLEADHGRLAAFADLAGPPLAGRLHALADLRIAEDGSLAGRVASEATAFASGIAELDSLLGGQLSVKSDFSVSPLGALTLRDLAASGSSVEGSGQVFLPPDLASLEADFGLAVPDLAVLQAAGLPLAGKAQVEGRAAGPLENPEIAGKIAARGLSYDGQGLGDVDLEVAVRDLSTAPGGRASFTAKTDYGPLTGQTAFRLVETARLDLTEIELRRAESDRVTGRVSIPFDGAAVTGDLRLSAGRLSDWSGLAGIDLSGQAKGKVALFADGRGGQGARLTLQGTSLAVAGSATSAALRLSAEGEDLLGRPRLRAEADLTGLAFAEAAGAGATFERVTLATRGDIDALAFNLDAEGQFGDPLSLTAEGEVTPGEPLRLRLAAFTGRLGSDRLDLEAPVTASLAADAFSLDGLSLRASEGHIRLSGQATSATVDLALDLEDIPVGLSRRFLPDLDASGSLDGRLRLTGAAAAPNGSFGVEIEDFQTARDAGDSEVPPLSARLEGRYRPGILTVEGRIEGVGQAPATLSARLPLQLAAYPPQADLPETAPLSADLRWSGKVEPLVDLLGSDVLRMEGAVEIDLAVAGTRMAPAITGTAALTQGLYENFTTGTLLKPLEIQLRAEGARIVVERFEGKDPQGGRITLSGEVDVADPSGLAMNLTAKAEKAMLVKRDDVTAILDGDLSLVGDLRSALASGSIRTERVEVALVQSLPASLTPVEVTNINDGSDPKERQEAAVAGPAFLNLDLRAELPGKVFVRGRGLDSEWRGSFTVTGSADNPVLKGTLHPVRGGFTFASRTFDLDREGSIAFRPGGDFDPELNLGAVYRGKDFTARVQVTGTASNPQIDLTSVPEMPRDEIIAQVLFGKNSTQLSAAEAFQVAEAAATLAGGDLGVLDIAREKLGVDVLTLSPGQEEGDLGAIRAGKYLSEEVFVGVEQGATPESTNVTVEVEIAPTITLESGVGANQESSVGLRWKWDY